MYQHQDMVSSFKVNNNNNQKIQISYKPEQHEKYSLTSKCNVCL